MGIHERSSKWAVQQIGKDIVSTVGNQIKRISITFIKLSTEAFGKALEKNDSKPRHEGTNTRSKSTNKSLNISNSKPHITRPEHSFRFLYATIRGLRV